MSLEVCVVCDGCGEVMGGGKNGAAARKAAREKDALTGLAGGRDLCRDCGRKAEAGPECRGFRWIGQSFATCDGCGNPAWEHEGEMRLRDGAGPFGGKDDWELRPWKPGEAEAIKRKWAPR